MIPHQPEQPAGHDRKGEQMKKIWKAPKVQTTPVSMEVTMYLPAQA
jgi:coenzyme PQQ precursor peptide PqqA